MKQREVAATGIEGLDHILLGGFPRNHVYLLQGDPGVGKTTLGLQFLLEGDKHGEKGLYLTLSETAEELRAVAESLRLGRAGLGALGGRLADEPPDSLQEAVCALDA